MSALPEAIDSRADSWRRVSRRLLPRAVLYVGIALILVYHFRTRPVDVEVVYEYGGFQQGLQQARIVYLQGEEVVQSVQFNYGLNRASTSQRHPVQLLEGDYTVELTLTYVGPPPPNLQGTRTPLPRGSSKVSLRRPLLVRGAGALHVYVAPEREN